MINNYICTLDIGSSKLAGCVARVRKANLEEVFFDTVLSKGIKRGVVIDSAEFVSSITMLLKNLRKKSGINIRLLYADISGTNITTNRSRSCIALTERGNKVVTTQDINRAINEARILGTSLDEEIIHSIPYGYSIDSQVEVRNPLGLYSHRLEAELYLISAKLSSVQNLTRIINQAGCEIRERFFSCIATSEAVHNKEFLSSNIVVCDIGSDITEIMFFEAGSLKAVEILGIGGNDLTEQLSLNFKIPFELAEDIKRSCGLITEPEYIAEDKEILVRRDSFYKPIKQREVSRITSEKAKEICQSIKEAIEKKIPLYEVNYFIVTGRSVLLEGFIETMENILNVPVKTGRITNSLLTSLIKENPELSGHKYLTYITSLGMLLIALRGTFLECRLSPATVGTFLSKALSRIKEVYQEYF
ncbi:MAG: cell division protein FtsA [Candidatus Omnitrophica bacterium]|nr:cell division protein FtsA [Candidatus Omnitrophota bacterium]